MKAVYPFIGGTATTHKWNLKDPQDTDAAFRLTFSGGWTHSEYGVKGNATNAIAETYLTAANIGSNANAHVAIYSRTDNLENSSDWGGTNNGPDSYTYLLQYTNSIFVRDYRWCDPSSRIGRVSNPARTDGLFILSCNSNTQTKGYRNNSLEVTTNANATFTATINIVIGAARWNTNILAPSSREYAFFSAGSKLDDTEAANLYWAVDKYQRLLSRNV